MVISKLINKLQELQKEHGDIEVVSVFDTYGTGKFMPLSKSGITFDRFHEGKNIVYIGW